MTGAWERCFRSQLLTGLLVLRQNDGDSSLSRSLKLSFERFDLVFNRPAMGKRLDPGSEGRGESTGSTALGMGTPRKNLVVLFSSRLVVMDGLSVGPVAREQRLCRIEPTRSIPLIRHHKTRWMCSQASNLIILCVEKR